MKQIPLDLALPDYALFSTFFPGPNTSALHAVEQAAAGTGPPIQWIHGPAGSGRSHLLQAAVAAAGRAGRRCAWMPLVPAMDPVQLEGMGTLELLCLDDIDCVADLEQWQKPLFSLYEEVRAHAGRLLVTAAVAPSEVAFRLPDLASRMASGPTWRLRPLADDELLQALQHRAQWRGLELPDDAGHYLLRRVDRSTAVLFALLDRLDKAALAAQRRLTVPLIRSVLNTRD